VSHDEGTAEPPPEQQGGHRMKKDKLCPIINAPCKKLDCAWYVVDYDEDVPACDNSDCAIIKTFEYVMCIAEGYHYK